MVNHSAKYLWLDKFGSVLESDEPTHPEAVSLLAAPGGQVSGDAAAKYKLGDRIKGDENAVLFDPAGNAIVIEDGRARAVTTLDESDERRVKGEKAEADRKAANRPGLHNAPAKAAVAPHAEPAKPVPAPAPKV